MKDNTKSDDTKISVINGDSAAIEDIKIATADLLFQDGMMERLERFAMLMAKGRSTIPSHLTGSPADCMAVCMQSAQWRMNPYAVAQKTFLAPGGKLGYEAQLVNSVLTASGAIVSRPSYEFFGPWEKVIGKFEIKKSAKGNDYAAIAWSQADEEGIGVIVSATLAGESKPRRMEVLLKQCWPRNSTQWATDPQQQITYAATQKWARRNCPDAILGVYSDADQFQEHEPVEREVVGEVIDDKPSRTESLKSKARAKHKNKSDGPVASDNNDGDIFDDPAKVDKTPIMSKASIIDGLGVCNTVDEVNEYLDVVNTLTDQNEKVECRKIANARIQVITKGSK